MLDRLTVAGIIADRQGTILYTNDALEQLLGWPAASLVGRPVTTIVPRRLLAAHRSGFARWAEAGGGLDGRYLRLPALNADGTEMPVGAVMSPVTGIDGQDHVLALIRPRDAPHEAVNAVALELISELAQEQPVAEAVGGLLRVLGERLDWDLTNLWVVDDDWAALRVLGMWSAPGQDHSLFQAATRETTFTPGTGLAGEVWASGVPRTLEHLDEDPEFLRRKAAKASGLRTGFAFPIEHDGQVVGVVDMFRTRAEPIDVEHIVVLAELGEHLGRYLERVRRQERDRRAEERLRLIAAGNELLARWLDYPAPLDDVCALMVPDMAEVCVIDLVRDTRLERVGQAFEDPTYEADVERLAELVPLETIQAGPIAVVNTGNTVVYEEVGVDELVAGLPADVPPDLLDRLAPASTLIVPLIGRGAVVGTLTLARRGGRFDDDDRRFAEELGRHVGLAVANAALFERERAVAAALQQSLLPPHLPDVLGMEIACRYEPGGTQLVVGGDFYDLFEVEEGCWIALVGDVCGTGAEAAAITSQVRYTARALASRVDSPAELLVEINSALLDRGDARFCTALVARLSPGPDGIAVNLANGGHPPPVLISRSGTRLVDCTGTLLGIYTDTVHDEVELVLARGESLALFTDGVIEARDAGGEMLGEERLVAVLDACVEEHAEKTADQLVQAAVDHAAFGPADDIAVLVLRHP